MLLLRCRLLLSAIMAWLLIGTGSWTFNTVPIWYDIFKAAAETGLFLTESECKLEQLEGEKSFLAWLIFYWHVLCDYGLLLSSSWLMEVAELGISLLSLAAAWMSSWNGGIRLFFNPRLWCGWAIGDIEYSLQVKDRCWFEVAFLMVVWVRYSCFLGANWIMFWEGAPVLLDSLSRDLFASSFEVVAEARCENISLVIDINWPTRFPYLFTVSKHLVFCFLRILSTTSLIFCNPNPTAIFYFFLSISFSLKIGCLD